MAAPMKTPGVYIVEKDAFPNSAVEVATAVPAFIGHTEKAEIKGKSLTNQPVRLSSLAEYLSLFGGAPKTTFSLSKNAGSSGASASASASSADSEEGSEAAPAAASAASATPPTITIKGQGYDVDPKTKDYLFFNAIRLFFENGGGPCYIVSVGDYNTDYELDRMRGGLNGLIREQEPTMIIIPEAIKLKEPDCITLQQAMLAHCGGKMKNRVAILDIYNGYLGRQPDYDPIAEFRNNIGVNYLDFSAAYYPWVHTTIVQDNAVSYENVDKESISVLQELLKTELIAPLDDELGKLKPGDAEDDARKVKLEELKTAYDGYITQLSADDLTDVQKSSLNKALLQLSPSFRQIVAEIKLQLNLLPPSAAMAGVITMVDNERGVWKAPANVSLSSVVQPAVDITHDEQEDLNVTPQGKSINAIRSFISEGTLVWGARTLDGNSLDWRYLQVRRTIIMLEESIKLAAKAYVFENNVANTWVTMKGMINNFLTSIWKRGGLAGTTPESAFLVSVGLGETMTPEDILEGILRITVKVALVRPAEFIEITFQQKMQES
ncbi:phage tail sheath family protein [Spartinivicinus poritis]|uniref:Phage tail sheath subtilisin-like domain-containing protein n=1 Tax=Spartinivicinus poritis TaxID=2994640 RepID=A0ABT5U370_9GAMM|nr:phage tail sheath C-terminal domain-containing protein [Spartinivicinus sp. A2-2]MDE1460665.1 phage tail sheath subtilisin-like domain-containing protein [Spartinivicinus sp. A2-2]